MKYKQALIEKNLKVEDLAKQTQKKIDELEKLVEYVESVDKADFDEEDQKDYDLVVKQIDELDIKLAKNIRKFNLEVYQKRLEVFDQNRKQRVPKKSEEEEEIAEEEEKEQKSEPKKFDGINKKLQEIKESMTIKPEKFNPLPEQQILEPEVEEVEDFEKKADIKPRKGSTAVILMAIGIGVLTFGSVWYFKDRR